MLVSVSPSVSLMRPVSPRLTCRRSRNYMTLLSEIRLVNELKQAGPILFLFRLS